MLGNRILSLLEAWADKSITTLIAGAVLLLIPFLAFYYWVASWVVMFAWNAVIPQVFDLTSLTQWQAFGLYLLSNMLIKSTLVTTSK